MRSPKPLTVFALFCLLLVVALAVAGCVAAKKATTPATSRAPEISPYDADAYINRGLAYYDKGQYDQAIADFNRALEINPRYTAAYNNRGVAYNEKGQYDLAIADYNRALEINPGYANAYHNREIAYKAKGQYGPAISRAPEISPNDAEAYYNRGLAYQDKGQYDQAIADFNRALEINPRLAKAYYNRGIAYDDKGQYDQAISDYNRVLEIDPRRAEAYHGRGNAYCHKGQYDQAIADYDRALEINPRLAATYNNREIAYKAKGQYSPATSGYNRAPEKDKGQYDSKGFYALESSIDFNVLDFVVIDPPTGRITLIGHSDARYKGSSIPYLDHLAELLENPSPEFSLNWTPESRSRVDALFKNFESEEYVKGLVRQWTDIMDANGHPTGQGRWLLPLIGIKPTSTGNRLGSLGVEVREITQHLKQTYERLEIVSVEPGSAADRAGLVPGDIITNSANADAFVHRIRTLGEGAEHMLMIRRKGQDQDVSNIMNITLGGTTGDPWAELDKFDIVQKMLEKAGNSNGAMLIYCLAKVQRINLGASKAGGSSAISILIASAGYNDAHWQNMAEYKAGRMPEDTMLGHAFRAILSAMENAFAFDDHPLTAAFDHARQTGADSSSAYDQTVAVLNQRIVPYMEQVMKTLLANHEEIQIPPDVMSKSVGPQVVVEVVPEYRGVNPHSALAHVLYSADYLGKSLLNMPSLQEKIPSYQSEFAFERNNPDKVGPWHAYADFHAWYSIESLDFAQSKDGHTLQTRGAKMRFNIREKSPGGEDAPAVPGGYEELLTSLYDDFASEFPVLHELRETAKLAGAAKWLKSKRPDLQLPSRGRISWSGPDKAPGFLYLTWSPQERPGRLALALSTEGGVSLRLVKVPKDIVGVADDGSMPVVDLSENLALISKILRMPDEIPVPQPVGWVTNGTKDGQNVTAVSFIPPKKEDSPVSVRLQQNAGDKAVILWKANDLEGAKKSLTDQLQKTSDPHAKANLMMMLAQILHENGEDAEAIKNLNEALRIDPTNPMLNLLIAKEKYDSGDLAGSEEALRKYLTLDPKNEAAAKLLTELQSKSSQGKVTPQMGSSAPAGQGWSVSLSPFTPPLEEVAAALDSPSETLKADSYLRDYHPDPYKLHGLAPPLAVPQGLAETKGWKKLEAQRAQLQQSYSAIESQLKEVRDKRSRGEGDPKDLDKQESQFQKQQLDIKKQQDAVDKKMTNDIVQWNENEDKKR